MSINTNYITDAIKDFTIKMLSEIMKNFPEYSWTSNPDTTKINIIDSYSLTGMNPNIKPVIAVERGPIEFADMSVTPYRDKNIFTESYFGQSILKGNLTIHVIVPGNSLLAERMASFIFQALVALKFWPPQKGVVRLDIVSLGAESPLNVSSDIQYMTIPIVVNLTFTLNWTVKPLNNEFISSFTINSLSDLTFTMIIK
jgi:hypothetical protein